MRILVTGAGGYLGHRLALRLASLGYEVRAMVRSDKSDLLLQHPNIHILRGDLMDKASLEVAMHGCKQVYHTAGKVGGWQKDSSVYYRINAGGTRNVMEVARHSGVRKIVFTSSAGVIGPSNGRPLTERDLRPEGVGIDYDLSKKEAEEICLDYAAKGLNVVAVLPAKIYGPGQVSHSLTGNALIARFINQGIALVPAPGTYEVCFSFIDDIVNGHLLAMEHGQKGERYILGGENISHIEFYERIRSLSACKGKIIKVSKNIVKTWAYSQQFMYRLTGRPPLFLAKMVDFAFNSYAFSSEKAIEELGYTITPFNKALQRTIQYLKEEVPA